MSYSALSIIYKILDKRRKSAFGEIPSSQEALEAKYMFDAALAADILEEAKSQNVNTNADVTLSFESTDGGEVEQSYENTDGNLAAAVVTDETIISVLDASQTDVQYHTFTYTDDASDPPVSGAAVLATGIDQGADSREVVGVFAKWNTSTGALEFATLSEINEGLGEGSEEIVLLLDITEDNGGKAIEVVQFSENEEEQEGGAWYRVNTQENILETSALSEEEVEALLAEDEPAEDEVQPQEENEGGIDFHINDVMSDDKHSLIGEYYHDISSPESFQPYEAFDFEFNHAEGAPSMHEQMVDYANVNDWESPSEALMGHHNATGEPMMDMKFDHMMSKVDFEPEQRHIAESVRSQLMERFVRPEMHGEGEIGMADFKHFRDTVRHMHDINSNIELNPEDREMMASIIRQVKQENPDLSEAEIHTVLEKLASIVDEQDKDGKLLEESGVLKDKLDEVTSEKETGSEAVEAGDKKPGLLSRLASGLLGNADEIEAKSDDKIHVTDEHVIADQQKGQVGKSDGISQ